MIYKYIGMALIVSASAFSGHILSDMGKRKSARLFEFIKLIKHISRRTEYFKMPLDEIYKEYEYRGSDAVFSKFVQNLESCGFKGALKLCEKELCIGSDICSELYEFASQLGTDSADGQVSLCGYYISKLEEIYEKEAEELPNTCRMYNTLGLAAGILVVIILI